MSGRVLSGFFGCLLLFVAATGRAELLSFYGLEFPPDIAGLERGTATNHEPSHPGLGVSVGYQNGQAIGHGLDLWSGPWDRP